jgi:4,5-dihydroxyphthalate decarboxylase
MATWDYDRVRALADGRVPIEGCELNYLPMPVEEVFHRAYFHAEFDIAEIGFSPYLIARSRDLTPYVAIPVFLSRMFRHSAIYIRTDRGIAVPQDLRGKRVGVPEYQMSAAMWARGMVKDDYRVEAHEMTWIQGGLEKPGRRDKFPLNVPEGYPLHAAPADRSLSQMLADGEIDALFSARAPSSFDRQDPHVGRLFPDFRTAERDYYGRTRIFPIMHAVGIRRELVALHPWLPASVYKAFAEAKRIALQDLREVAALKVSLPWLASELAETQSLMGADYWPYGIEPNRHTLETMARYSFEQGLAVRNLKVDEMFAESTLDQVRV